MSTAFAPHPWPAPWRFAREQSSGGDAPIVQWLMSRHSAFAPTRLGCVHLVLCMVAMGLGAAFWWPGALAVLPLAGFELLLLGAALWMCSRHAGDGETITLAERELKVEHRYGRTVERAEFRAEWVRVEPAHGEESLVELSGQGQRMRVGRYLRPDLRLALARELRVALRRSGTRPAALEPFFGQQR